MPLPAQEDAGVGTGGVGAGGFLQWEQNAQLAPPTAGRGGAVAGLGKGCSLHRWACWGLESPISVPHNP